MKHISAPLFKVLAIIIGLLFCPNLCQAKENRAWLHEFRLGVLDHDVDNLWSGFSLEKGIDLNAEVIFSPNYELWHGQIRPNIGVSVNDHGNTSKVYAGGVWQFLWQNGFIFDLGAGLALHDGTTEDHDTIDKKQLGSRLLLHFSIELGYSFSAHNRLFLMFDHISNGYTTDPNEGLDTLGLRYGYLF